MKTLLTSFFLAAFIFVTAQTTLPPGMAYVPNTLLNYDYWADRDKNYHIRNHYAAKYLESNYQYQYYLRYLKAWGLKKHWEFAQPDTSVWEIQGLTPKEKAYLKANYWTAKEYEHYPVVGLDYEQVRTYLHWKSCMLNLAAYEAAGGTDDYISESKDSVTTPVPEGFPKLFSIKEYLYKTSDSTRIFRTIPSFRLPTAQELFSELPLPKKTRGKAPADDKKLLAWLKTQPQFGFLLYEPPKAKGKPTELQLALETLGIRPVVDSDLDKMKKRKDAANLPLLCMEQHFPNHFYKEGFVFACDEEDLKNRQADPNFNPKNLRVVVFDPKKAGTVAWVSERDKLRSISIADLDERPLCGFRAMMTRRD